MSDATMDLARATERDAAQAAARETELIASWSAALAEAETATRAAALAAARAATRDAARAAPSTGPINARWRDKPAQVLYDVVGEVIHITAERDAALEEVERLQEICKELQLLVVHGDFGDAGMNLVKRRGDVLKKYEKYQRGDRT